jgi:hypothetical protein
MDMVPGQPEPRDPNRGAGRGEKQDEKEQEKKQEKGEGLDEKYRRDPLGFVGFALLIIWFGVTLLLQNLDVIGENDKGWAVFAWGAAVIFIGEVLLRLAVPRWRRSVGSSLVVGIIATGVGFGLWYENWDLMWPIVIIAVGVALLAGRLVRRR